MATVPANRPDARPGVGRREDEHARFQRPHLECLESDRVVGADVREDVGVTRVVPDRIEVRVRSRVAVYANPSTAASRSASTAASFCPAAARRHARL
jgi:hypothetical protein